MVTLTGLIRTLSIAAQPFECLPYQGRKTIVFTNGWRLNLSFPEFRDIRDSFISLKNHTVKQLDDDFFEVDFGDFKITASLHVICKIADFFERYQYQIVQLSDDAFRIKGNNFELEGTVMILDAFTELDAGEYRTNYEGKIVLDVGGFQGESAVYFWISGAKKIIIYEPIREYCRFIEKNMRLNQIDAEIHQSGIGNKNSIAAIDVYSEILKVGDKPKKEIVKITNVQDVISESGADIAKIDCEGAETCLLSVSNEVLRKIPLYILELHGQNVRQAITAKFLDAGFKVTKNDVKNNNLAIVHFQKGSS